MKNITEFLSKWGMVIIVPMILITFFKSCSTSSNVNALNNKVDELNKQNDSLFTQVQKQIKIEGLESEKRMIQSTDRKLMDVNRQSEIDKEIKELQKK
jgi:hypothetical protein